MPSPKLWWAAHRRGLAWVLVMWIGVAVLELLNKRYLHLLQLYPFQQSAGTLWAVLTPVVSLSNVSAGGQRSWRLGLVVWGVLIILFHFTDRLLVSNLTFDRISAQWLLPFFYGCSFGALSWTLTAAFSDPGDMLDRDPTRHDDFQTFDVGPAMKLASDDRQQLHRILTAAFPGANEIDLMTTLYLELPVQHITGLAAVPHMVLKLIQWAEAQGRVSQLVEAAREANPTNPELRELAARMLSASPSEPTSASAAEELQQAVTKAEFSTAAELSDRDKRSKTQGAPQITIEELQRIALRSVDFYNTQEWRNTMAARERAVCRVEFPCDAGQGTGFLIGPGLVMTNYHVLEPFIEKRRSPSEICCRFGYQTGNANNAPEPGKAFALVDDWLVAASPIAALDYVIVRLKKDIADDGSDADPLKPKSHAFETGEAMFVIQHPKAAPLKIASGGVVKAQANRVFYLANTLRGSSGSPCFTANWELVALHRGGEGVTNVGVPFGAILLDLKAKNLEGILS